MRSIRSTSMLALALVGATALAAGAFPRGDRREAFAAVRDEAFTEADADGNKALDAQEFATFHEVVKRKLAAAKFAYVDANGDGQVTAEELAEARPPRGGCHGKPKPTDD